MMSTLNKVPQDIIVTNCTESSVVNSLTWTVPTRLDQIQ